MSSACFDLFQDPTGKKLAADKKSIAYTFHYRSPERTLKAKEVDEAHQKLLEQLAEGLAVHLSLGLILSLSPRCRAASMRISSNSECGD